MRVLHTVPALFTDDDGVVGGAERYVLELARHMASAVDTSLVTFGAREREERIGRLRIRVLGNPWHVRGQRFNPVKAALVPEVLKADVVHCHQQHILASTVAAVSGRLTGKRVVCTDLGGGGWDLSSYISTDSLFQAHLHISEHSRHVFGHDGRPNAHVIWGGVDTDKFSPAELPRRDETNASRSVVFVGRLLPHKGVDTLIRALPAGLALEVIGPASHERYVRDLHGMAEGRRVTFRHDCSDGDIIDAYRHALCVVLPSVYDDMYGAHSAVPELLGQTLLEGMACGVPGVTTRVASLPEVVEDGVSGFVVPPNDISALGGALTALAEQPELRARLGQAARRRVQERFSWPAVVARCLDVYAHPGRALQAPPVTVSAAAVRGRS